MIFTILCCCQVLFSQTEFAPVGAEWYYQIHFGFSPYFGYNHFTIVKDTVFLETECRKAMVERINPDGEKYDEFSFFLYDDDGKLFISYRGNFELLYDFNLNVGDTLKSIIPFEYIGLNTPDILYTEQKVDSIQTIEISGFNLKRLYLSTFSNSYFYSQITERLGGNDYFFPYNYGILADIEEPSFRCYHDSEIDIVLGPCDSTNNSSLSAETVKEPDVSIDITQFPMYLQLIVKTPKNIPIRTEIDNLLGIPVYSKKITLIEGVQFINTENLNTGIYFLRLYDTDTLVRIYKFFKF